MSRVKDRKKGDTFRPVVRVLKEKKGVPTSIMFNGQAYALVSKDYINGAKSKVANKGGV